MTALSLLHFGLWTLLGLHGLYLLVLENHEFPGWNSLAEEQASLSRWERLGMSLGRVAPMLLLLFLLLVYRQPQKPLHLWLYAGAYVVGYATFIYQEHYRPYWQGLGAEAEWIWQEHYGRLRSCWPARGQHPRPSTLETGHHAAVLLESLLLLALAGLQLQAMGWF